MIATTCPSPSTVPMIQRVIASTTRVRRWETPPGWLAPGERAWAARIRQRRSRDAWLTARLTAKRLVATHLTAAVAEPRAGLLSSIEIRSRDPAGRGSRPRVLIGGREAAVALSIAHVDERVLVAIGPAAQPLGVDLTPAATFATACSRWWLTAAEREEARDLGSAAAAARAARLWSVKEAVYKALLATEAFRPRAIEVRIEGERIARCTAAGRAVPVAGIRSWHLAGHWLALVQAADGNVDSEA